MKILITGAGGNVGRGLVHELGKQEHEILSTRQRELDITAYAQVQEFVAHHRPAVIIHCAALTNVDRCANEPDEALRINALGTQNIAIAAQRYNAALCYLSTNEVFDGETTTSYLEYDPTHPANPYGYSKWVAEQMIQRLVPQHYIVRLSWLFAHGGSNFLQKIVALAQASRPISVVTDETASPTYAEDFVPAVAKLVQKGRYGIYHLVNEGKASRYEFARHILDCFGFTDYPIKPILKADFVRPSHPPTYSVLRNFIGAQNGLILPPWQDAVATFVDREKQMLSEQVNG